MIIKNEIRNINNVTTYEMQLVKDGVVYAYSKGNNNCYIERDGLMYTEAIDPLNLIDERVYTETDIPIEDTSQDEIVIASDEATVVDYKEALVMLGVE